MDLTKPNSLLISKEVLDSAEQKPTQFIQHVLYNACKYAKNPNKINIEESVQKKKTSLNITKQDLEDMIKRSSNLTISLML